MPATDRQAVFRGRVRRLKREGTVHHDLPGDSHCPGGGSRAAGRTVAGLGIPELAVMANVLNSEPESITLNTEIETPTLDPAAENEQPSPESTSISHQAAHAHDAEAAVQAESPRTDADATSPPAAEAQPARAAHESPEAHPDAQPE